MPGCWVCQTCGFIHSLILISIFVECSKRANKTYYRDINGIIKHEINFLIRMIGWQI